MVIAKWVQIRVIDKVISFEFIDKNGDTIGSRGITMDDNEIKEVFSKPFSELYDSKFNGIEIPTELVGDEDIMIKLGYRAYQEYLEALTAEQQQQNTIITLE